MFWTLLCRVFAANICDKISQMIHNIATPVELKLSLIPVFQYMHHDVSMATKVTLKRWDKFFASLSLVWKLTDRWHVLSLWSEIHLIVLKIHEKSPILCRLWLACEDIIFINYVYDFVIFPVLISLHIVSLIATFTWRHGMFVLVCYRVTQQRSSKFKHWEPCHI